MSTILLTGAAGFIAARVAQLLLADGHTVLGLDNLNDAYDVRLKQWRLNQLRGQPNFRFYRVDIAERRQLSDWWAHEGDHVTAVINLAARAGVRQSTETPEIYYETNVNGTLNLLELCRRFGVEKFVLASSSSLYGSHNSMPCREDADTNRPLSPYAASKKAAEALCYSYHYLHGLDITVFRYFTVYGPACRPDMSPFRLVQKISEGRPISVYGDGTQSRDFTYVDDIARGTIAGLKRLDYEIINLGSDRPVVLLDAIALIEQLTGCPARLEFQPRHKADVTATWSDISKAQRLLGWRPQVDFAAGMGAVINWYRRERQWAKHIDTGEHSTRQADSLRVA